MLASKEHPAINKEKGIVATTIGKHLYLFTNLKFFKCIMKFIGTGKLNLDGLFEKIKSICICNV